MTDTASERLTGHYQIFAFGLLIVGSFIAGIVSGAAMYKSYSSTNENTFPWALKEYKAKFSKACDRIEMEDRNKAFFVLDQLDHGRIARVLSFDPKTKKVKESIIDPKHRHFISGTYECEPIHQENN